MRAQKLGWGWGITWQLKKQSLSGLGEDMRQSCLVGGQCGESYAPCGSGKEPKTHENGSFSLYVRGPAHLFLVPATSYRSKGMTATRLGRDHTLILGSGSAPSGTAVGRPGVTSSRNSVEWLPSSLPSSS